MDSNSRAFAAAEIAVAASEYCCSADSKWNSVAMHIVVAVSGGAASDAHESDAAAVNCTTAAEAD